LACAAAVAVTGGRPAAAATSYGVVATIPLGECSSPSGVSVDPATDAIYVASLCITTGISTGGEVTQVNGATNQVTGNLPLGEGRNSQGTLPRVSDVAVDPATNTIFEAVSNGVPQLTVVNGATDAVTATIPTNVGHLAVDSATGTVFVTTGSAVSVISEASDQVTATIPLSSAGAVAVDSATGTVFVTTGSAVSVISEASHQVTATIPLSSAGAVAVDSATGTVFVTTGSAVSVISEASDQVTATIPLSSAGAVAVDPSAGVVYVAVGTTSAATAVIDASTNQVTATVPASSGYTPTDAGVGVDPSTHTAYASAGLGILPPDGILSVIGSTSGGGTGQAPAVTTNAASAVTSSGATVGGSVNPEGQSTTYRFDYGTSTSYGSSVPSPAGSAGSGTSAVTESASLTGLRPGTVYHYRIEATNAAGTTFGADKTFTTARHR
jgi:hypothetical protein